jgi:ABC-2 type transport system permease protein
MQQLLALVRLDLRLFFSDRRALLMLFLVPIGIASFTGSIFGGSGKKTAQAGRFDLLIVDQDRSAMSQRVLSNFRNDSTFRVTLTNEATARELVLAGKRPVALLLPAGFGANALPGLFVTNRKPVIRLLHDPSRSIEKSMVEGMMVPKILQSMVQTAFTIETGREFIRHGLTNLEHAEEVPARDRRLFRELMLRSDEFLATRTNESALDGLSTGGTNGFSLPLPFVTQAEPLVRKAGGEYNGYAHSFAGMGLQFVLMSMLEMAVGLLRERQSGMFRRLRAVPLARPTLLGGKGVSYALISLLSLSGCFAFAMLVFGVRIEGSWPGFLGCVVSASLLSASFALMLAALGNTPAGTRGIGITVTLLLVMIGGAWVPPFVFPDWLQTVSLATPTRWAVDGFDAMTWRGLGINSALGPIAVMLGFTAAFVLIALARFKWQAE